MRTPRVLALLGAVAVGCGPSASYDGLTGGSRPAESSSPTLATSPVREDDAFAPPRPVAPLSVSVVASARPRLRWENVDGAIGVVVDLSKKRTFPVGETKTFPLDGEQAEVPEDLDGGMWFWRLRSRAEGRLGKVSSPVWQMYVRGPMKGGASPFASGSVVDVNGDGIADFLTAADEKMDEAPVLSVFEGQADGTFQRSYAITWEGGRGGSPIGISGGTDIDGDGLSDFVHTGVARMTSEPRDADAGLPSIPRLPVFIERGSAEPSGADNSYEVPSLDPSVVPTAVAMAGDVNGDGYGDVLHMDREDVVLSLGGPKGIRSQSRLFRAAESGLFPMAAGFDANADGLADFAHRADERGDKANLSVGHGDHDLAFGGPFPLLATSEPGFEVRAIATGDFDGDGLADVAVSSKRLDATSAGLVCFFFANKTGGMTLGGCVEGARTDVEFGLALTAVDVDGDGRDELLVGVKGAGGLHVAALRPDAGSVLVEELAEGMGAALSTVEPGRVGSPGRWIASNGETVIRVYAGTREVQSISAPPGAKGFGRTLR